MHGDIVFHIQSDEAKKTIKDHLKESEAHIHTIEDLSVKAQDSRNKAWALVYELMAQEKKKLPPGRVYVIDKQARIVDIGPAKIRRSYDEGRWDDDIESILDAEDEVEQS